MWFFSRKHNILETPFFEGFKDFHSHILPAVDDGVKSMEESLAILEHYEQLKISDVVLTPHVMSGVNENSEKILATFESLQSEYKGGINLSLASEYMLDSSFASRYAEGARRIGESHILVETSYFSAPRNFSDMLFSIMSDGVTPIVAHPERYAYMPRDRYHRMHEREYALQLNLLSFSNAYGEKATKNAIYLLEQGLYSIVGTDIHGINRFKAATADINLSTKHVDMLLELKTKGL